MRAARQFVEALAQEPGGLAAVVSVKAELFGSLGHTGKGHGSDVAVILGLEGERPESVDCDAVPGRISTVAECARLTLLGEHCVWTSGVGLRTGRVEQEGASRAETSVVHPDLEPVPARLLRAAVALEDYQGEDRYILHMQRVLALARQGLVMAGGPAPVAVAAPVVQEPPAPGVSRAPSGGAPLATPKHEGLTMLLVLGVGLIVGVGLMLWLL